MAIFKKDVDLLDAPGGNPTGKTAHMGTKAEILDDKKPPWLQVRAVDEPGDPTGWVLRTNVIGDADAFAPFKGTDLDDFAEECVRVASDTGVSAHYLLAVAEMRTKITDGDHAGVGFGPFALSADEWATFGGAPYFKPPLVPDAIRNWASQCAVFGAMSSAMQTKLALNNAQQPMLRELYLAQLVGSAAFKSLSTDLSVKVADAIKTIAASPNGGDAKAEGVDLSHVMTRFAALLGGSGQGALDAISAAMDPALAATSALITKFASAADTIANSNAKVPTTPTLPAGSPGTPLPVDNTGVHNAYPALPVYQYARTSIDLKSVVDFLNGRPEDVELKRAAYISFCFEGSSGHAGVNNNYCGFQADGGPWPAAFTPLIAGTSVTKDISHTRRRFVCFKNWQDCIVMLLGALKLKQLFVGSPIVGTPNAWEDAYWAHWVANGTVLGNNTRRTFDSLRASAVAAIP